MPHSVNDPHQGPIKTPTDLRIMAARARRLAWEAGDAASNTKLIEFADELEVRAAALEVTSEIR